MMLLVKGRKMEKTKCSICEDVIIPDPDGWNGGHNAEPVNSGRCCGTCNTRVVTPTRIVLYLKNKEKRGTNNGQKQ